MAEQTGAAEPQHSPDVVPLRPRPDGPAEPGPPEPLLRTVLGGVLRNARHDQQRTLADVADEAGVSMPYLSEIERGRKEPSSEVLGAVGTALGLDLLDLIARAYADLATRSPLELESMPLAPIRTEPYRRPTAPGRAGDVLALAA